MSNDNEASVKITADASGVAPGVDAAKSDLSGLSGFVESLKSSFADFGASIKETFSAASEGAVAATEKVAGLGEGLLMAGERAKEMGAGLKEGLGGIHEGIEGINEFKRGLQEAFEVYMAFLGIEMFAEMAEKMGEAAEQTEHLAQRFGMTTSQLQGLRGVALGTGVSFDTMTKGMTMLDKVAETTPEKFTKLGINIKAGASQMDILNATADRFKDMAKGPDQVAAAFELMGRNGATMLPILDQGAAGIQALMEKAKSYGEVNEAAVASGLKLAESVNEAKMAWDGLKQTMTEAFAPLLTELVDGFNGLVKAMTSSYESGGAVKTVFVAIVDVIEGFGEIFNSIGDAVGQIFTEMGYSAGNWQSGISTAVDAVVYVTKLAILGFEVMATAIGIALDIARGNLLLYYASLKETFDDAGVAIDAIKIDFQTLGTVMMDALTLKWDSINADWDAGMAKVAATVKQRAAEIAKDVASIRAKAAGSFADGQNAKGQLQAWAPGFMQSHGKPKSTGVEGGDGEGGGDSPDLQKAPKAKSDKPSIVEEYKSELQDELLAEKNWGVDVAEFELAFWQQKQAITKTGTKEWLQIHKQVQSAQLAAFKEEQADELATIKATNATKMSLAKDDNEIAKIGLQEKLEAIDEEEKAGEISAVKAAQLRATINQQLLALDRSYEIQVYQLKVDALNQEANLAHQTVERQKQIYDQLKQMAIEQAGALKVIDAQANQATQKDSAAAADAIRAKWTNLLQPIASAWGQSLQAMITGTGKLRDMMANVGNAILTESVQWIEKVVVKWIAGEMAKTAATGAGAAARTTVEATSAATTTGISALAALKQIAHSAAVAAARVYAAIAQIPVVGPILAPAAAALALAAVIKLGQAVFSAEGGEGEVMGNDVPYRLHRREMVLPANLATPLRAMLLGGGSGGLGIPQMGLPSSASAPVAARPANMNAPAAANSNGGQGYGDIHLHFPNAIIADKKGIEKFMMDNKSAVHGALRAHVRAGGSTKPI